MIAELRQQLYDLKGQDRDYKGVTDEIHITEGRYRHLSDDKVRSELEQRARLNRDMDEVADLRKQIDDLKFLLSEKYAQYHPLIIICVGTSSRTICRRSWAVRSGCWTTVTLRACV